MTLSTLTKSFLTLTLLTTLSNASKNIEAGPIWSTQDAQKKCPTLCEKNKLVWSGHWWTTVQGKMSVCQCAPPKKSHIVKDLSNSFGFDKSKKDGQNIENAMLVIGEITMELQKNNSAKTIPKWDKVKSELSRRPTSKINFNKKTAKDAYDDLFN